jgi:[ribosomal protein S18]-alanine N-acetyltransferase
MLPVHIRWMIRRDFAEVMAIENASFAFPMAEEEMLHLLRQRNCIGMVAEAGYRVVGHMVYSLYKTHIEVLDFAVDPAYRRQGVGHRMVGKLVGKLSSHRRTHIDVLVRESDLDGQLFFKIQGFKAIHVDRGCFLDTGEDAYLFSYDFLKDCEAGGQAIGNVLGAGRHIGF